MRRAGVLRLIDTHGDSPNSHYVNQVADALMKVIGDTMSVALLTALSDAGLRRPESTAYPQNGAPTHKLERQGRWKQGAGMIARYTRGETAGSALRYL